MKTIEKSKPRKVYVTEQNSLSQYKDNDKKVLLLVNFAYEVSVQDFYILLWLFVAMCL